jgi:hypothetical protein
MPLPTSSACSDAASPGGQTRTSRGTAALVTSRGSVFPPGVVAAAVDGNRLERLRLVGVANAMMSVAAVFAGNVALGPGEIPVITGVVVPVVDVGFAALVVVVAGPTIAEVFGSWIAPEVASGDAPGAGGAGPVAVVAMVDGEVEVVPLVADVDVEDADCASAALAVPIRTAAAKPSVISLNAIAAPG